MHSLVMNIVSTNECSVQLRRHQADTDPLVAASAEALFTSDLSASSRPSPNEVEQAIRHALARYGGVQGCAAEVAFAYGDHPETAAPRMRWALDTATTSGVRPGREHDTTRLRHPTSR
jgi:hypothetical protein